MLDAHMAHGDIPVVMEGCVEVTAVGDIGWDRAGICPHMFVSTQLLKTLPKNFVPWR